MRALAPVSLIMMDSTDVGEVFVYFDESDESDTDDDSEETLLAQEIQEGDGDDEEEEDINSEDNEEQGELCCKKCGKKYHLQAWLKKHEDKCEATSLIADTNKTDTMRRKKKSTPALNGDVVKLISELNYDCYFEITGSPSVYSFLKNITNTPGDLITLRGERFASAVQLSRSLLNALNGSFEEGIKDRVLRLMKSIGEEVWLCVFEGDVFKRSDYKWGHTAQVIHHLRNDQEVKEEWMKMVKVIVEKEGKSLTTDCLLLQKLISMFYNSILEYRCESCKGVTVNS